jgi:hypothetical protein
MELSSLTILQEKEPELLVKWITLRLEQEIDNFSLERLVMPEGEDMLELTNQQTKLQCGI